MKCPKCGNELRISKKDPNYCLCDTCRKKFKTEQIKKHSNTDTEPEEKEEHFLKYANIPPKAVREKKEREMRQAYDELLAIGEEERKKKKKKFLFF